MNNRIKELRKALALTQHEFANKLNTSRNNIAGYEIGKSLPSDAAINNICREFNVNESWLRNGTGNMFLPYEEDKLSFYMGKIVKSDDYFIKDLIEVYMELDKSSKDTLKLIAQKMIDKQKEHE